SLTSRWLQTNTPKEVRRAVVSERRNAKNRQRFLAPNSLLQRRRRCRLRRHPSLSVQVRARTARLPLSARSGVRNYNPRWLNQADPSSDKSIRESPESQHRSVVVKALCCNRRELAAGPPELRPSSVHSIRHPE